VIPAGDALAVTSRNAVIVDGYMDRVIEVARPACSSTAATP